jgi:capsid portal protein
MIERKSYLVRNQGRCITPIAIWVRVLTFDETTVWYVKEGDPRVYDTTIDRFEEILERKRVLT